MTESLFRRPELGSLAGRSIVLSASVPSIERSEVYRRVGDAQVEIEEAVVSLARAVFSEGGCLVFGGHPSITPLVAMVAGEYVQPSRAEPTGETVPAPVVIHQSEAFRASVTSVTTLMESMNQAKVVWYPSDPAEQTLHEQSDRPPYPNSLRRMRAGMLRDRNIVAMVCIGGMEGVEEEVALFEEAQPKRPIYVLARTGGACAEMSRKRDGTSRLRIIDDELLNELRPRLLGSGRDIQDAPLRSVPYAFIMQRIVREVSEGLAR